MSLAVSRSLLHELGFRVTPTAGAADHARVLLDRSYIEVPPTSSSRLTAGLGWFLRPHDVGATAEMLRSAGINVSDPAKYAGHDGTWIDVEPVDQMSSSGLPTFTRRTDLDETAWPPPLSAPHPNGVTGLAELHVYSREPDTLGRALEVIGAGQPESDTYTLGDGTTVVVTDAPEGGGISALVFSRPGLSELWLDLSP